MVSQDKKPKRPRNVTLKEVAREAGVTPMTVSNVLNRRKGEVGEQTRKRVQAAIEKLGYRPHAAALQLRSQSTLALGMFILDDVPQFLNDPFTSQVVAGLSNIASERQYSLVLQGVRSDNLLDAPLLSRLQTDGVCAILSGTEEQRRLVTERLLSLNVPLVLLQEVAPVPGVCCVRQDDAGGGRLVAEYLIQKGARDLMFLAPGESWPAISNRHDGIRAVCDAAGTRLRVVRCGDETLRATQEALAAAIGTGPLPDAVVGGNDRMAMAAMAWLQERGLKVPDDIRVTGFNGFDASTFAVPRLVTVRSDAYELGRRAGQELLAKIGDGAFSADDIVLPVAFVPGESA
jgi:LacI family transcriptional regulator